MNNSKSIQIGAGFISLGTTLFLFLQARGYSSFEVEPSVPLETVDVLFYMFLAASCACVVAALYFTDRMIAKAGVQLDKTRRDFVGTVLKLSYVTALSVFGFAFYLATALPDRALLFSFTSFLCVVYLSRQ